MRITAIQMQPGHDKAANIAQAAALVGDAIGADQPDLVTLPEMWSCLGGDRATKFAAAEILPEPNGAGEAGAAYAFLRDLARARGITVHGGSIAERAADVLFNTTLVFDPSGAEIARYRKIHLFDIVTPSGAGYRESATFGAGDAVVTFEAGGLRMGCAICYDVRFPELFLALRRAGAEVIFLPAAFTLDTGKDHWEVLIRARAIETQCWMVAAATTGRHEDGAGQPRYTYGHSLIADPWGHVVARASDGPGWTTARIDPALTARMRRNMPVLEHRRLA
ncbi:MAG TPA: carbon-nitrogen hydrolase family protein [Acetobacteraceae bacterium]|nr:carbon-nitrogen hydrolase family protein [Acetobacteraceae bacterium]